jgi:hypothetical protein
LECVVYWTVFLYLVSLEFSQFPKSSELHQASTDSSEASASVFSTGAVSGSTYLSFVILHVRTVNSCPRSQAWLTSDLVGSHSLNDTSVLQQLEELKLVVLVRQQRVHRWHRFPTTAVTCPKHAPRHIPQFQTPRTGPFPENR